MAQDKARAVSAFCLTEMDMQLRSKHCARPAIHCSTKLPFPLFTTGVQNLGVSGVWSCRSRLNNSAAGGKPAEIQNPNPKFQTNFNQQIAKISAAGLLMSWRDTRCRVPNLMSRQRGALHWTHDWDMPVHNCHPERARRLTYALLITQTLLA